MSLTKSPGPLSTSPTPTTNYRIEGPKHRILFEPHPRRIRAELGGVTVLDTVRGRLLHESNVMPRFYVPLDDIDQSLLERTDRSTHCPFKGDASYWTVRAGDRVAENAIWAYEDPKPEAAWLAGYASMYWEKADAWYEEDERVFGHLRDPSPRVDIRRSSRRARVLVDGEVVAETTRARLLFETQLPTRFYLPREDVRAALVPSSTRTYCPFKGEASYWSVAGLEDVAWSYEQPRPDAAAVAGLVAFWDDRVDVLFDGARRAKPGGAIAGAVRDEFDA